MDRAGRLILNLLKQPGWLRAIEIATGLLTIVFGILVLVFPGWGMTTLVILLSVGLFFTGIQSIALLGHRGLPSSFKVLSVATGVISLILAVLVVVFPRYGVATLLIFVSFGLIVSGFGRLFLAYELKATSSWIRGLLLAVGLVAIILSAVVLFLPGLALLTFATVLAIVLLVSGAEMIVSGAIGRTWLGDLAEVATKEM